MKRKLHVNNTLKYLCCAKYQTNGVTNYRVVPKFINVSFLNESFFNQLRWDFKLYRHNRRC